MLTLSHWVSCLMFILLKFYKYPRSSWAVRWDLVQYHTGKPVVSVAHAYSWGIYKTLLLLFGDAYQEFPSSQICIDTTGYCVIESWMTLVGVFLGSFFNAAVVSTITSILVSMDVSMQEFEEQLQRTTSTCGRSTSPRTSATASGLLPPPLGEGVIFDESLVLERLNPELCLEILNYKSRTSCPRCPSSGRRPSTSPRPSPRAPPARPRRATSSSRRATTATPSTSSTGASRNPGRRRRPGPEAHRRAASSARPPASSRSSAPAVRCKHLLSMYSINSDDMDETLEEHPDVRRYIMRIAKRRVDRLQVLHLNAQLENGATVGTPGSIDEDDEDARTPLFTSAAAKRKLNDDGPPILSRIRKSLADGAGRVSSLAFANKGPSQHVSPGSAEAGSKFHIKATRREILPPTHSKHGPGGKNTYQKAKNSYVVGAVAEMEDEDNDDA